MEVMNTGNAYFCEYLCESVKQMRTHWFPTCTSHKGAEFDIPDHMVALDMCETRCTFVVVVVFTWPVHGCQKQLVHTDESFGV